MIPLNTIRKANSISYFLDTCQGDSGGPIMYYSENEQVWVLAGITSYGRGCGLPDYAVVYTRVSVYIDLIQSIVGDDGIVTILQNKAYIYSTSNLIVLILSFFLIVIHIYRSKI
jgi:secreted trypsin-like serine protease